MLSNFLSTYVDGWFLPVIIVSAIIDSVNPCAFSILFLTLTFLFSLGKDRKFILLAGGLYILGIALVYTFIGIGALQVLSIFNLPNGLAKIWASILVLYCVIGIIGEFFPRFPLKLKIPDSTHTLLAKVIHRGSAPMSFLLGILVWLFEFPCTGGPYLFVLGLLHDQNNFWRGLAYLIIYNIFFVAPLIVMLLLTVNKAVLEKLDRLRRLETRKTRLSLLLFLLVIAILIFFI